MAGGSPGKHMTLAAEVLVQPQVRDTFGTSVKLKHTRMRHEVGLERKKVGRGIERIFVVHEKARSIAEKEDRWPVVGRPTSRAFRNTFLKYGTQPLTWLETMKQGGRRLLRVHDQGDRPAEEAEATFLSTVTTAREQPYLFALREELRLAVPPTRSCGPPPTQLHQRSRPVGGERVQSGEGPRPDRDGNGNRDTPARATGRPGRRPGGPGPRRYRHGGQGGPRREVSHRGPNEGGPPLQFSGRVRRHPANSCPAVRLDDPKHRGLVCLEEPENGIHPGRLKAVIRRVRELVSDPQTDEVDEKEPLGQMIVSSHSPVVLTSLPLEEVVFFDTVSVVSPGVKYVRTKTRVLPSVAQ